MERVEYYNIPETIKQELNRCLKLNLDQDKQLNETLTHLASPIISALSQLKVGKGPPIRVLKNLLTTNTNKLDSETIERNSEKLLRALSTFLKVQIAADFKPVRVVPWAEPNTNSLYSRALEYHTEGSQKKQPPDFIMLSCLKSEQKAKTLFISAQAIKEELEMRGKKNVSHALAAPRYTPDYTKNCKPGSTRSFLVPILSHPKKGAVHIRFSYHLSGNRRRDERLLKTLSRTINAMEESASITLEEGDVIIFDNRRVLHGRSAYMMDEDPHQRRVLQRMEAYELLPNKER